MVDIDIKLNENDTRLLFYCRDIHRSISDIARHLKISPASIVPRVEKLDKAGLIVVKAKGKGKPTLIRTREGIKTNQHLFELLDEVKKKGGLISYEEFFALLPFDMTDPKDYDKANAPLEALYGSPPLFDKLVKLNEEGERFLKEHKP